MNRSNEAVFDGAKHVIRQLIIQAGEQRGECWARYKLDVRTKQFHCSVFAESSALTLKCYSRPGKRTDHNDSSGGLPEGPTYFKFVAISSRSVMRASTRLDSRMMRRKSLATALWSSGPVLAFCSVVRTTCSRSGSQKGNPAVLLRA